MEEIAVVIFVILIYFGRWFTNRPAYKGSVAEKRVSATLGYLLNPDEYRVYNDLTLPTRGGTTQIDHVVLSRFGVFVIETKNMQGWIFGNAEQAQWTQVIYGKKTKIPNPLRQNFKHVKAVQELTAIHGEHVHNVVAFVGSAVPKSSMPLEVSWSAKELTDSIRTRRRIVLGEEQIDTITALLSVDSVQSTKEVKRAHIRSLKENRTLSDNSCPRCGSPMVMRENKRSGENFLGCSNFPKCRGTCMA